MSIDVVRDNIARAIKQFAFQHTPVSVTGTAAETTLFSTVIPGGTMGANGVLEIKNLFSLLSSTNNKTMRVKFGGVVLWYLTLTAYKSGQHVIIIRNRNAQNSQVGSIANTTGAFIFYTADTVFIASVDTSVDQTLTVTGQLATPTNTKSVISLTCSGSTATAIVTAHGYANAQSVLMAGANQTEYNGTFVISNVTTNMFDYTVTGTPATPATGTITAALWDIVTLESVMVEVKKS